MCSEPNSLPELIVEHNLRAPTYKHRALPETHTALLPRTFALLDRTFALRRFEVAKVRRGQLFCDEASEGQSVMTAAGKAIVFVLFFFNLQRYAYIQVTCASDILQMHPNPKYSVLRSW